MNHILFLVSVILATSINAHAVMSPHRGDDEITCTTDKGWGFSSTRQNGIFVGNVTQQGSTPFAKDYILVEPQRPLVLESRPSDGKCIIKQSHPDVPDDDRLVVTINRQSVEQFEYGFDSYPVSLSFLLNGSEVYATGHCTISRAIIGQPCLKNLLPEGKTNDSKPQIYNFTGE